MFHVTDTAYDDFMGRYSTRLAPVFADFAGVREGQHALDVGAGTGALTAELLRRGATVAAAEPSPPFCAALRERYPQVEVHEIGGEQLPFDDDSFDVALAQLVVSFMADAPASIREMARVAPTVAACMWSMAEVEMFAAIDRTAKKIDGSRAEPGARRYRTMEELVELLSPVGDIESIEFTVTGSYAGYDDFWHALEGQVGPAGAWLKTLDEEQLAYARENLHRELGGPSDAFELTALCYAARATRA